MATCKDCVMVNTPKCPYHASPEDNVVGCKKFKRWERENYKVVYQAEFPVRKRYKVRFTVFRWKDNPPKAKFVFMVESAEGTIYYYKNKVPIQLPVKEFVNLFDSIVRAVKENCPQALE